MLASHLEQPAPRATRTRDSRIPSPIGDDDEGRPRQHEERDAHQQYGAADDADDDAPRVAISVNRQPC